MRVGFTGTRNGLSQEQADRLVALLDELRPTEVHHGDAVGADADFDAICRELLRVPKIVLHPCNLPAWRANCAHPGDTVLEVKPPLVRNRDIVEAVAVMLACPRETVMQPRGGTWSTIRFARLVGKRLIIVYPDGSVEDSSPNGQPEI